MLLKLFANCILLKGATRAVICDLQRSNYHLIPMSLFDLFDEDMLKLNFNIYNKQQKSILYEYVEFLTANELAFTISQNELELFPKLSLEWDYPSKITNIIIDIKHGKIDLSNIISQIEDLRCYYLQFRFFRPVQMDEIISIGNLLFDSLIHGFEALIPNADTVDEVALTNIVNLFPKLKNLIVYNHPEEKEVCITSDNVGGVFFINSNISSAMHCGVIHPAYFAINIETFTESQHHNSCLNRKISIDVDGEIKNCPSLAKSYGNIKDTKLIDVVNNPEFQKVWHIKKDEITKCKDCEFRHICTDCRAYLENPEDRYSAPLKCGYNPYTCEWEEWSSNPLKKQAIEHYGMQELINL